MKKKIKIKKSQSTGPSKFSPFSGNPSFNFFGLREWLFITKLLVGWEISACVPEKTSTPSFYAKKLQPPSLSYHVLIMKRPPLDVSFNNLVARPSFKKLRGNFLTKYRKMSKCVNILRMYCIDTEAIVFMFNGGSSHGLTIHPIFTRICMLH